MTRIIGEEKINLQCWELCVGQSTDIGAGYELGQAEVQRVQTEATAIIDQIERVIVGKREVIERIVIAMLCEGHVLIEDVPGVGKTVLARALAATLGGSISAHSVHPRLVADRCHRRARVRPTYGGVLIPARSDCGKCRTGR